jgi:hypothetical protein
LKLKSVKSISKANFSPSPFSTRLLRQHSMSQRGLHTMKKTILLLSALVLSSVTPAYAATATGEAAGAAATTTAQGNSNAIGVGAVAALLGVALATMGGGGGDGHSTGTSTTTATHAGK